MTESYLEIPQAITIKPFDIITVENTAKDFGESPEFYMQGCIGLVATWGQMIDLLGSPSSFEQGLIHPESDCFDVFDIVGAVNDIKKVVEKQKTAEIDIIDQLLDAHAEIPIIGKPTTMLIPAEHRDNLTIACKHYTSRVQPLISAATGLRATILKAQKEGGEYVFTKDYEKWYSAKLPTFGD